MEYLHGVWCLALLGNAISPSTSAAIISASVNQFLQTESKSALILLLSSMAVSLCRWDCRQQPHQHLSSGVWCWGLSLYPDHWPGWPGLWYCRHSWEGSWIPELWFGFQHPRPTMNRSLHIHLVAPWHARMWIRTHKENGMFPDSRASLSISFCRALWVFERGFLVHRC